MPEPLEEVVVDMVRCGMDIPAELVDGLLVELARARQALSIAEQRIRHAESDLLEAERRVESARSALY